MDAHRLLAVEQRVRYATHLAQHNVRNVPCFGVLLQCADVEADGLFDHIVLPVRNEERPVRQMDHRCHHHHAREKWCVVDEFAGKTDQTRNVLGRRETLDGMDLASLRGKKHLAGLHTDIHVLNPAEAEVGPRAVQHDGASSVDHVCLEKHFVNVAVVVYNLELRGWEVQTPIDQAGIYHVDGCILELSIETRYFKNLTKNPNRVDEVGEGREYDLFWCKSSIVVFFDGVWVRYLLYSVSIGSKIETITVQGPGRAG